MYSMSSGVNLVSSSLLMPSRCSLRSGFVNALNANRDTPSMTSALNSSGVLQWLRLMYSLLYKLQSAFFERDAPAEPPLSGVQIRCHQHNADDLDFVALLVLHSPGLMSEELRLFWVVRHNRNGKVSGGALCPALEEHIISRHSAPPRTDGC